MKSTPVHSLHINDIPKKKQVKVHDYIIQEDEETKSSFSYIFSVATQII